ncbi:Transcriptional regulator, AbiEi antitoxin, Type IV TA system [Butyrivibrio fibrisolvens DSM 3071]|uniref:Transcriptional regulator, AbiEi antitoxin, Type IV TA system n=1 Tax=Butyrivibrio fibrisolvens DSM 3071 TaxID=1121131 RepID=A0A1M5ZK11_BUTFI|nr:MULTISPECIES: DUF6088 family protein [Butyrivibrio]MCR5770032.1 DUF6088 family protein [Butyrivibrio sp.]SHI24570.1 Transcriptional regulator, AbiEi antitoxin, Type IV TA system [Butyrivibrio fibrisolvens DSM 3071]
MREKYQIEIEKRIEDADLGYAFSAIDFADIAGTDPTNKALSRLGEAGTIRRVIKGIYDKPLYSKLLGEYSSPNIEKVAQALARKYNWTIAPSGETALNFLHLSTQVPNSWSYISDGPYRKYDIGSYQVEFKHCANKEISGKSFITISVIQAIKYIGKDKIQQEDKERLSKALSSSDKEIILREAITTTAWIYKVIKEICS